MFRITLTLALSVCLLTPAVSRAQGSPHQNEPDTIIDSKTSREVIDGVLKVLDDAYVFPETAKKMVAEIRGRLERKEYDSITSARELARTLTDDMQRVSKDKHLGVFYSHDASLEGPAEKAPGREARERRARGEASNFGFEKAERLDGNIGYLDLRGFHRAEFGGDTATAAMTFLANTDALIIDLRENGGGSPSMVSLISSYLFGPEPVHLFDLYSRPDNSTHQWWSLPCVPGKRYGDKPVYVLTSRRTFSAGEGFAYILQVLKRATIIGEPTGGGAHVGRSQRIHDHFEVSVPTGRAISPITRTNWEGTGVLPDVSVPAELALKTAHLAALTKLHDDSARRKDAKAKIDASRVDQLSKAIEKLRTDPDVGSARVRPPPWARRLRIGGSSPAARRGPLGTGRAAGRTPSARASSRFGRGDHRPPVSRIQQPAPSGRQKAELSLRRFSVPLLILLANSACSYPARASRANRETRVFAAGPPPARPPTATDSSPPP